MPVKKIATDLGVSRNAVYLQIERLRDRGVLPPGLHALPASRPAPRATRADAGPGARRGGARARASAPGSLHRMRSELAELRRPAAE